MIPEIELKKVVRQLIEFYASLKVTYGDENNQIIIDDNQNVYELKIIEGFFQPELVTLIQIEIRNQLIWINHDGTDEFLAYRLEKMGVPKNQIVLGFLQLSDRMLSDYANGE